MLLTLIMATAVVSYFCFRDRQLFLRLALSPYMVVQRRQAYRLISHMLVHGDWMHLLVNMLVLYSFADAVLGNFSIYLRGAFVSKPELHFLILYLGGGLTAALLGLRGKQNDPGALSVGASAGVSAVVFASILFAPWRLIYIFALIPLPGVVMGGLYLLYSWRMAGRGADNVDHMAHFYGAIFGLLYPISVEPTLLQHFFARLLFLS